MARPHTELSDTCNEIVAWAIFESFAKKVIRNKGRSLKRDLLRKACYETPTEKPMPLGTYIDRYPSDNYRFRVGGKAYTIHDELVYRGLVRFSEKKLGALVMYYWELWSDAQIGALYGVGDRTVRKWRRQSIDQIRQFVKGESTDELDNRSRRQDSNLGRGDQQ